MRRIVLVDPGIGKVNGHNLVHARALEQECARRGISLEVLASTRAAAETVSAPLWKPVFRVGLYERPRFRHWAHSLAAHLWWSRKYRQDFCAALDGRVGGEDLLLLNTVTIGILAGFAGWLSRRSAPERPAAAIVLRFGAEEGLPRFLMPDLSRALYRRVLDRLHRLLGPRLLLATDTRLIGEDFERLIGRPVASILLPIDVPAASPPRPRRGQVHLVFPTAATPERGFHLLPDAVARSLDAFPELSATIRVANPLKTYPPLVERLRAMAPRVRLIEDPLDDAGFHALLSEADGVLLPYDPVIFAKRSSQILAESASLGRAVIVSAGSFLDRERRASGIVGVAMEAFTSEALAEAIARFVRDKDTLVADAWAACPAQRRRHGTGPFVESLLGFAADRGKPVAHLPPE